MFPSASNHAWAMKLQTRESLDLLDLCAQYIYMVLSKGSSDDGHIQ